MKLIELPHIPSGRSETPAPMLLTTDSSIVTGNRPVFLADLSERWELELTPAYRISRLGKTIATRFASRYYDAVTLAARLIPLDIVASYGDDADARMRALQHPLVSASDFAVTLGKWVELSPEVTVTVTSPVESVVTVTPPVDEAISLISRHFTVKTGDVVVADSPALKFAVKINTHIEASIGTTRVLSFNIK